jgi:hypothetical protein
MSACLLPDNLYFVNVRAADAGAAMVGFKNSVFGFERYKSATQVVDFLKDRRPNVFYTHVRSNTFRLRADENQTDGGVTYEVARSRKADYRRDLLRKNVSIRLVQNVDLEADIPEALVTSSFKIDPENDASTTAAFLEHLLQSNN